MEQSRLFAGILFHKEMEEKISETLSAKFGALLLESSTIPFDFTQYYHREMGQGLLRKWLLFDAVIEQDRIADIKNATRAVERDFSIGGNRRVNIDPGYITLSKIVLATTKDCAHRIYLNDGIYAEITLLYHKAAWQPQPWTYPDYITETALEFFSKAREYILCKR